MRTPGRGRLSRRERDRSCGRDADTRTYKLVTATEQTMHVDMFDINESTGQILTKEPLNHEVSECGYITTEKPTTCTYTVKVRGGTAATALEERAGHLQEEDEHPTTPSRWRSG